jgi:hypothetical protein
MHTPRPLQLLGQPLAQAATASIKKQSATSRAADLVAACIFIIKPKRKGERKITQLNVSQSAVSIFFAALALLERNSQRKQENQVELKEPT